jgi:DNA-directed RNA polymerase subunit RPC12/RpoP
MGLEYVFASELKLWTCPYCGSSTFNVTVGRKVVAEEKWSWEDGKRRVLERTDESVEMEAIYGVKCANCGKDLWDYAEESVPVFHKIYQPSSLPVVGGGVADVGQ